MPNHSSVQSNNKLHWWDITSAPWNMCMPSTAREVHTMAMTCIAHCPIWALLVSQSDVSQRLSYLSTTCSRHLKTSAAWDAAWQSKAHCPLSLIDVPYFLFAPPPPPFFPFPYRAMSAHCASASSLMQSGPRASSWSTRPRTGQWYATSSSH